jgi:hypothetical protein
MIHFKPPLPLLALLALYWSRHVCMRAFPADSLEYFGDTAVGNTALDGAAAGFAGAVSLAGTVGVVFLVSVVVAGLLVGSVAVGAALALLFGLALAAMIAPAFADQTGVASMHALRREGGRTCMSDHFCDQRGDEYEQSVRRNQWPVDNAPVHVATSTAAWGRSNKVQEGWPGRLGELGFSLSIDIRREQQSVEISSHSEQTRPLSVEGVAVHVRGPPLFHR